LCLCGIGAVRTRKGTASYHPLQIIEVHQRWSGYNKRARVEATMGRWKQVIGDGLRAHTDERRATEVTVAVHALNRMLELGRPSYVRVA